MHPLCLALALSLPGQVAIRETKTFKPDDRLWEAKLPGTPKKSEQTVKAARGAFKVTVYMVEIGDEAYGVILSDFPDELAGGSERALDNAMKGTLKSSDAKLLTSKPIKMGDVPGLAFESEVPTPKGKMIGRYRFYLAGQRLYQVVVMAFPETARSADATRILDSFKLAPTPTPVASIVKLKPFKAEDGEWEVLLPGTPEKSVRQAKSETGDIDINIFMVAKGNNAYGVIFSNIPDAKGKDPDKILEGAQSGAINAVKGKLVSSKDVVLNGFPGRAIEYEVSHPVAGKLITRQHVYLVEEQLYQVIVVADPETARNALSTQVLDSFKVKKQKPGASKKARTKARS